MRASGLGFVALALSVQTVLAQGPADRAEIEKQIMKMEQAIHDAFAKNNAAGFMTIVAEDAFAIDASGLMSFRDVVKRMGEIKVKITNGGKIDSSRFQWLNDSTAVHAYRWTGEGSFIGRPVPSPTWASSVWTSRGGRWVVVFHQQTPAGTAMK